jgi:hypothetical protein
VGCNPVSRRRCRPRTSRPASGTRCWSGGGKGFVEGAGIGLIGPPGPEHGRFKIACGAWCGRLYSPALLLLGSRTQQESRSSPRDSSEVEFGNPGAVVVAAETTTNHGSRPTYAILKRLCGPERHIKGVQLLADARDPVWRARSRQANPSRAALSGSGCLVAMTALASLAIWCRRDIDTRTLLPSGIRCQKLTPPSISRAWRTFPPTVPVIPLTTPPLSARCRVNT